MDNVQREQVPVYMGNISAEFLQRALDMLSKYKGDKGGLEARVTDNNRWYKARYWSVINPGSNEPQPATAYIFNAIMHKYADAVDNYPAPNFVEREKSDADTARLLSKIVPSQLDMCGFKRVYKDNWLRKLKHGTAVYGVFYDETQDDIKIQAIDILNVYCDMYIKDIQDSPFLFITNVFDNDQLKQKYPEYSGLFYDDATIKTYSGEHTIDNRTEVVDCYYKKYSEGRSIVHMMKICNDTIIEATEDIEGYEEGIYEHGLYPVVLDVLYQEEDSPFGFGVIDVIRNPQMYTDKLDAIILKNAMIAGKFRYLLKDNGGVNEAELKDLTCDIVHVAGGVSEDNIRQLQASPLSNFVMEHREKKIDELKEVIGNRDFQQGGTSGGVTAASAISVLQQAGEKLSRAMIDDSYDSYRDIIIMVVELMRQFYSSEHTYRITNEMGQAEYQSFSNANLMHEVGAEYDSLGFPVNTLYKKAEFDISVIPQRQNPFSKEANNQTIVQLWQMGLFNPQNVDVSLIVLQALQFDGKDKLISDLQELQTKMQMQSMQGGMQSGGITDLGNGYSAVDLNTSSTASGPPSPQGEGLRGGIRDLGNGFSEIDLNSLGGRGNG